MSANFTPDMTGYKGLSPFRFWCQKTLPLVYDDSLSYYELLCKVVSYINNLITDVAAAEENVDKLLTAYNQLQEYVNNYFDGADFQQKIDDSLDRYAEDGTLSAMVNTHVRALLPYEVGQQIGDVVDEQLPPVVDLKLGGVVDAKLPDVVDDKLEDVVRPMIVPAVSGLLPQEVGRQLPDEVETQLPGVISEDLETIAPPVIEQWLDDHPDATTSVEDGSISLVKLNTVLQRLARLDGNFYPTEYDPTVTYYTDDMCTYRNTLTDVEMAYKCIATSTTGTFSAADWAVVDENDIVINARAIYDLASSIAPVYRYPNNPAIPTGTVFFYRGNARNAPYGLWRATTDIPAATFVTPSYAERITILELISKIDQVDSDVTNLKNIFNDTLLLFGDRTDNLMPIDFAESEINGVDVKYFNGKFVFDGTATAAGGSAIKIVEFELPAGTYIVSRDYALQNISPRFYYGANSYVNITVNGASFTLDTDSVVWISFNLTSGAVYDSVPAEIMLVLGSEKQEYKAPIDGAKDTVAREEIASIDDRVDSIDDELQDFMPRSDNLMPSGASSAVINDVTSNYKNGEFVFNGTASATGGRTIRLVRFSLEAGTYNISMPVKPDNLTTYIQTDNTDNTRLATVVPAGTVFTLSEKTDVYIGVNTGVSGAVFTDVHLKIMLVSGEEKKSYEPPIIDSKKQWSGVVWACVGDSLTAENTTTTKHYFDYIKDDTGINVINMGVGGTGYAKGFGSNNAFYQRIADALPTSGVDLVTIFGSGNDLNNNGLPGGGWTEQLGTPSDQTGDTICGCINLAIDAVYTKLPLVRLALVLPTPWASAWNADAHRLGNADDTITAYKKWGTYCDAIKQICINRGIPYLDLYHESSLRPWDAAYRALCYSKDAGQDENPAGTHPDETGHAIIAPMFKALLTDILRID